MGWLGPFCLCQRAVDSALSSVHPSRPGLVQYKWPIEPKLPGSRKAFSRDLVAMLGNPELKGLALYGAGGHSEWRKPVDGP